MKEAINKLMLLSFILLIYYLSAQSSVLLKDKFGMKTVAGKLYYISKGNKFPASFKQIVIMPSTPDNLKLSQDIHNLFDDNVIVKIKGAKKSSTDKDGNYELKNITPGKYIIRVTGMGGMVIKFVVPDDNNTNLKIPEMPADYYYKRIPSDVYIKG